MRQAAYAVKMVIKFWVKKDRQKIKVYKYRNMLEKNFRQKVFFDKKSLKN